jgi:hypothetical protein
MWWVVSITPRPRFSPGERTPGTHCTGGWVGPIAGLDTEAAGKILSPLPGIEPRLPGRPVRSQTLYWLSCFLTLYATKLFVNFPQGSLHYFHPHFHQHNSICIIKYVFSLLCIWTLQPHYTRHPHPNRNILIASPSHDLCERINDL